MTTRKSVPILHPFLFAIFPILSLYALNAGQVKLLEVLPSLLVTLTVVFVLLLIPGFLLKNWNRAGAAVSVVVVLFFSFGHIYRLIHEHWPDAPLISQANVLAALWAIGLILGPWAMLRVIRVRPNVTRILNVMSACALVAGLVPLVGLNGKSVVQSNYSFKQPADLVPEAGGSVENRPDIYYIILDAYGRADALQELYGVDNTPFLNSLREKGFQVADQSTANYWRTIFSLSSSLNFHYIDDLMEIDKASQDLMPLDALIHDNAVRRFLETQGYQTVWITNGEQVSGGDTGSIVPPNVMPLNEFERTLLGGSLAIFWLDALVPNQYRATLLYYFDEIGRSAAAPGPKFVFAHLQFPHPPFVFDEQGNPMTPMGDVDGQDYPGGRQQYLEGYAKQVVYADKLVEKMVDDILTNSAQPPVIILQGDHGPGAYLDWNSIEDSCLSERFPILNAVYLPDAQPGEVPADLTPVNTFRMIFNRYFDTRLALEDNRNYAFYFKRQYDLIDVTGRLDSCPDVP